jgi:hypothetical protein
MARRFSLRETFSAENLRQVWRAHVWPALRDQSCEDLIEYYDYNVMIDENVRKLSSRILNGNYRTSATLALEVTKADKLVRRTQVPTAEDALVFQAITEAILPAMQKGAPTSRAFFSRSHTSPRGIHTLEVSPLYPWFKLWPKYQTDILDFAKAHRYLVVTDIQNFFDSIPHWAIDRSLSLVDGNERACRSRENQASYQERIALSAIAKNRDCAAHDEKTHD